MIFLSAHFHLFVVKFSIYLNRPVFVMSNQPAHPRSMMKILVVRMKTFASLVIRSVSCEDSDEIARMRRFI